MSTQEARGWVVLVWTYDATRRFQVGDGVHHAMHGRGTVLGTLGGARIEVLFADGRRILPHARDVALAPPTDARPTSRAA